MCRKCSEVNGVGLVRCWSCGAFLREEIEAIYHRMLAARTEVEYIPLPEIAEDGQLISAQDVAARPDQGAVAREGSSSPAETTKDPVVDPETDFELDPNFAVFVDDDELELVQDTLTEHEIATAADPLETVNEDATYSLSGRQSRG